MGIVKTLLVALPNSTWLTCEREGEVREKQNGRVNQGLIDRGCESEIRGDSIDNRV